MGFLDAVITKWHETKDSKHTQYKRHNTIANKQYSNNSHQDRPFVGVFSPNTIWIQAQITDINTRILFFKNLKKCIKLIFSSTLEESWKLKNNWEYRWRHKMWRRYLKSPVKFVKIICRMSFVHLPSLVTKSQYI